MKQLLRRILERNITDSALKKGFCHLFSNKEGGESSPARSQVDTIPQFLQVVTDFLLH